MPSDLLFIIPLWHAYSQIPQPFWLDALIPLIFQPALIASGWALTLFGVFLLAHGLALRKGYVIAKATQALLFGIIVATTTFLTTLVQEELGSSFADHMTGIIIGGVISGIIAACGEYIAQLLEVPSRWRAVIVGYVLTGCGLLMILCSWTILPL